MYCSGTVSLDEVGYGVRAVAVICQLEPHNLVHIAGRSLPSLNDNNYCLSLTMREHVLTVPIHFTSVRACPGLQYDYMGKLQGQ